MFKKILSNREWCLKLCLSNRKCYISGKNLWLKYCYRGQKKVKDIVNRNNIIVDEIWLSKDEYYKILSNGIV